MKIFAEYNDGGYKVSFTGELLGDSSFIGLPGLRSYDHKLGAIKFDRRGLRRSGDEFVASFGDIVRSISPNEVVKINGVRNKRFILLNEENLRRWFGVVRFE